MKSSLRQYVRSILAEGVKNTGMTTRDWWSKRGVNYAGDMADSMYFVYTDDAGNEVTGTPGDKGDPFTYQDIGSGKLRVISGPVEKSVGAVIDKEEKQKIRSSKQKDDSGSSSSSKSKSESDQEIPIVKKFSASMIEGMYNVMLALLELEKLQAVALRHQDSIPSLVPFIQHKQVDAYFSDVLGSDFDAIEISASSRSEKADLGDRLGILAGTLGDVPAVIQETCAASSTDYTLAKLASARSYISKAARYLSKIDPDDLSGEDLADIEMAELLRRDVAFYLKAPNTYPVFEAGLAIFGGRVSNIAAGQIVTREIAGLKYDDVKKNIETARANLLYKIGLVSK